MCVCMYVCVWRKDLLSQNVTVIHQHARLNDIIMNLITEQWNMWHYNGEPIIPLWYHNGVPPVYLLWYHNDIPPVYCDITVGYHQSIVTSQWYTTSRLWHHSSIPPVYCDITMAYHQSFVTSQWHTTSLLWHQSGIPLVFCDIMVEYH